MTCRREDFFLCPQAVAGQTVSAPSSTGVTDFQQISSMSSFTKQDLSVTVIINISASRTEMTRFITYTQRTEFIHYCETTRANRILSLLDDNIVTLHYKNQGLSLYALYTADRQDTISGAYKHFLFKFSKSSKPRHRPRQLLRYFIVTGISV